MVGETHKVIIDEVGKDISIGRTQYDAPEIDKIVRINEKLEKGTICKVKIDDFNEYKLFGSLIK